jgi:serine/threonine-protein kinase
LVKRILEGRYQLIEPLGCGGMGSVWRAKHLALDTEVAIKLLNARLFASRDALRRFRQEARTSAALTSPHLARVIDYGVDEGCPYIVMELLQGETLAQLLARELVLPPWRAARLLSQAAKGLAWAHECGTVHRDFKPDNLFIAQVAGEEVVKLLDFGVAKVLPDLGSSRPDTRTGAMLGTPFYMSPEQASGRGEVDHRSDIWAFGVTAYQCLVGKLPFYSSTLGGLVIAICSEPPPCPSAERDVPLGFDEWFARCVARAPEHRYQSVTEMAAALHGLCGCRSAAETSFVLRSQGQHRFTGPSSRSARAELHGQNAVVETSHLGVATVDATCNLDGDVTSVPPQAHSSSIAAVGLPPPEARMQSTRNATHTRAVGAGLGLLVTVVALYVTVAATARKADHGNSGANQIVVTSSPPELTRGAAAASSSSLPVRDPSATEVHSAEAERARPSSAPSTSSSPPVALRKKRLNADPSPRRAASSTGGTLNRAGF